MLNPAVIINRKVIFRSRVISKPLQGSPPRNKRRGKMRSRKNTGRRSLLSSAVFPLYNKHDVYGLGYTCEPTQVGCLY